MNIIPLITEGSPILRLPERSELLTAKEITASFCGTILATSCRALVPQCPGALGALPLNALGHPGRPQTEGTTWHRFLPATTKFGTVTAGRLSPVMINLKWPR